MLRGLSLLAARRFSSAFYSLLGTEESRAGAGGQGGEGATGEGGEDVERGKGRGIWTYCIGGDEYKGRMTRFS